MTTSKPRGVRFAASLVIAAGSTSYTRSLSMPSSPRKASAWNSDWLPVPIIAITDESGRARWRATIADVAAVRSAVSSVISERNTG